MILHFKSLIFHPPPQLIKGHIHSTKDKVQIYFDLLPKKVRYKAGVHVQASDLKSKIFTHWMNLLVKPWSTQVWKYRISKVIEKELKLRRGAYDRPGLMTNPSFLGLGNEQHKRS